MTDDPGASDSAARRGSLSIRLALGRAKSHSFRTGQTLVMRYNRQLMQAILWDCIHIADVVGVKLITLEEGPQAYAEFVCRGSQIVRDRSASAGFGTVAAAGGLFGSAAQPSKSSCRAPRRQWARALRSNARTKPKPLATLFGTLLISSSPSPGRQAMLYDRSAPP